MSFITKLRAGSWWRILSIKCLADHCLAKAIERKTRDSCYKNATVKKGNWRRAFLSVSWLNIRFNHMMVNQLKDEENKDRFTINWLCDMDPEITSLMSQRLVDWRSMINERRTVRKDRQSIILWNNGSLSSTPVHLSFPIQCVLDGSNSISFLIQDPYVFILLDQEAPSDGSSL